MGVAVAPVMRLFRRAKDLSIDDYETLLLRDKLKLPRRLFLVGLLAVAVGVAVFAFGAKYEAMQEGSAVHFTLPDRLIVFGSLLAGVGALFVIIAAIIRVRDRRQPDQVPRARALAR